MDKTSHPYFVPDSTQGNRKDTAVLLVGTATEKGIPQREVAATQGGFRISQAVYDALGWNEDADSEESGEVGENDARQVPGSVVATPADSSDDGEEPVVTEEDDADNTTEDDDVPPYSEWAYNDLRAEVTRRGITTDDQRGETLIAALSADDEAVANDPADTES